MAELKNWISFTQRRYIDDDVNRQWKQHNPDNAEKLHWEVSNHIIVITSHRRRFDEIDETTIIISKNISDLCI